tara:strand:- start:1195 stop:1395 length:201 start_codon:yes stop_codon:yes gene_type:complete
MIFIFLLLNLQPCFTTKHEIFMVENQFFQVNPAWNSYPFWYGFSAFFIFGNIAILFNQNGFLHIIN